MMYELTELEELLNTLETSSLEPHEEYTMKFSNRRQTIILNYIKELQQQLSKQEKRWNDLKEFSTLENWSKLDTKSCVTMFNNKMKELEEKE